MILLVELVCSYQEVNHWAYCSNSNMWASKMTDDWVFLNYETPRVVLLAIYRYSDYSRVLQVMVTFLFSNIFHFMSPSHVLHSSTIFGNRFIIILYSLHWNLYVYSFYLFHAASDNNIDIGIEWVITRYITQRVS